jgi:hypothetical protein
MLEVTDAARLRHKAVDCVGHVTSDESLLCLQTQLVGSYSINALQGIRRDVEVGGTASAGADPRGGYYAVGF